MRVKLVKEGAVIRDPHTKRLATIEGIQVSDSRFWRRRIAAGEVELIAEEEAAVLPAGVAAERGLPTGLEPVAPLTTRRPAPLRAPAPEHAERRGGTPDAGGDDE